MKLFFACFGAAHIIASVIGALGVIDYRLCISKPGKCIPTTEVKHEQ
jgi:hypothetical protein